MNKRAARIIYKIQDTVNLLFWSLVGLWGASAGITAVLTMTSWDSQPWAMGLTTTTFYLLCLTTPLLLLLVAAGAVHGPERRRQA